MQKQHAEKLRDELRDRDNEIIQLKLDFQTAKQRMNSSVGMQVQMMNEQKKAKEEAAKKGEELDSLRHQVQQLTKELSQKSQPSEGNLTGRSGKTKTD